MTKSQAPASDHPATRALHTGRHQTPAGENSEALFLASSFTFADAAQAAARFAGDEPGNIYTRFTNPTVQMFEERLAALEGGERCIATSSGMSAIQTLCMSLLQAGDHIVASNSIFGTTVSMFTDILPRFGVTTTFVALSDPAAWRAALTPRTRMLFCETPSNPLTEVGDIALLAEIAHEKKDRLLAVDNCFCTPALQQPLRLGADAVIHSATKYLDGQGRCVGGAIVGAEELLGGKVFDFLRRAGPCLSPFNAWVFLKGLETLRLRMPAHCDNALRVATWLQEQEAVEKVYYPGLPDHPQHELAARQQAGFGGIVSLRVRGDRDAAWRVIDNTRLFAITANLGDARSTITHPDTTTHHRLSPEHKKAIGVTPNLIRLSVGLEDSGDLIADLERGLG